MKTQPSTPADSELSRAFAALLPPEQAPTAAALAEIIADLLAERISPQEAEARLAASQQTAGALQTLAGRQVALSQATISFGAGSQMGDVTIGDTAGRDIVKLNVNIVATGAGRRQFLLIAGGLTLLAALSLVILLQFWLSWAQNQGRVNAALAADVLTNIGNLDSQLGQVTLAMRNLPDPQAGGSYRSLLSEAMLGELRESLNTDRLSTDQGATYVQNLVASGADAALARNFYEQLREVDDNTGELLDSLGNLGEEPPSQAAWIAYYRDLSDLNWRRLQVNATIAHLNGLLVLDSLGYSPAEADRQLALLQQLLPGALPPAAEIEAGLAEQLTALEALVAERRELVARGQALLAADLTIRPDDSWDQVVAKAISLRKLGDIDGAVSAFARYGELFAASDPTAEQYSRTAQAFTLQSAELDVDSAMYIYNIYPDSNGLRAGLQAGDIVVELNGTAAADPDGFAAAAQALPPSQPVLVTVLRPEAGGFERLSIEVSAPPIGIDVMPI